MSTRTLFEKNRRLPNLRKSKITEVLPGHYPESYPNLVKFLDEYYESMDQPGEVTDTLEYGLFALRDLDEIELEYIDHLFYEIGNGAAADYFKHPRFAGKLLTLLIRNKGNLFSTQLFFRLFFDEEPEVIYPKNNILHVFSGDSDKQGEATIGPESLRYTQDGARYQLLSVLIKSGQSFDKWSELYKRFVHPAGFYLSSAVGTESLATMDFEAKSAINELPTEISFELPAYMDFGTPYPETTLLTDSDGTTFITNAAKTIERYQDLAMNVVDSAYDNIFHAVRLNTFTLDDSDATGPSVDGTYETIDTDKYDSTW